MTNNIKSKFKLGDHVTKIKGSQWTGRVVGTYSTKLTPEGYAVESSTEIGSVQIYPANALALANNAEGVAEDYLTHHHDFRKACEIARNAATEEADRSYWQHQMNVLDRIDANPTPAAKVAVSDEDLALCAVAANRLHHVYHDGIYAAAIRRLVQAVKGEK